MEDQRSWLGAKYKYSQCPPPGHHVAFGPRKERDQIQHVLGLDSDYRTAPTCDVHHGRIRTPFWAFKYSMESLWSLLSYGFRLMSIYCMRRQQWSNYYRVVFCQSYCVTLFWPDGLCIKSSSLGTHPRVGARPQHPGGRPSTFIYPLAATKNSWVLFCWKFNHCYFLVDACVD